MFEELKQIMQQHDGKINIHLFTTKWSEKKWTCMVELKDEGLELKATAEGFEPEEAVNEVYIKFMRLVNKGAPQLLKVITHQPTSASGSSVDDEIPF